MEQKHTGRYWQPGLGNLIQNLIRLEISPEINLIIFQGYHWPYSEYKTNYREVQKLSSWKLSRFVKKCQKLSRFSKSTILTQVQKLSRFFLKIRCSKTFKVSTGRVFHSLQKDSRFLVKVQQKIHLLVEFNYTWVRILDFPDPFYVLSRVTNSNGQSIGQQIGQSVLFRKPKVTFSTTY